MMNQWQGRETFLGRLRVCGRGLDPVLARLRLATLLSGAHLSPAGLAPSAILCVRRLRGPAPASLSARAAGGILSPDWERAVTASLGEMARRAARPAHGAVPANAEAVIFADQAEMLACLVSDCCEGSAAARWWWQTLFRGAEATPVRALLDAPACIPAALEHLACRGKAVLFARTLTSGEARALLLGLARVFALARLEAALDGAFEASRRGAGEADGEAALGAFLRRGRDAAPTFEDASARRAPWHAAVPEGAGLLAPEQQTLLGVALMLMRAPTVVRTQTFARDTRRWLLDTVAHGDGAPAVTATRPLADQTSARRSPVQALSTEAIDASSAVALSAQPARSIVSSEAEANAGVEGFHVMGFARKVGSKRKILRVRPPLNSIGSTDFDFSGKAHVMGVETANQLEVSSVQASGDARVSSEADHASTFQRSESDVESSSFGLADDANVEPHAARALSEESAKGFEATETTRVQEARVDTARLHMTHVETRLGGIFYLINLALFLELYGDFTSPATPGLALSPWDFLALAGAELTGASFRTDPLWALLAQLAGRGDGEAPGAGFVPPDEWRVHAAWLEPFAEHARLTWTARDGRLRVRHPEGFLLLDLSLKRRDARTLLARETKSYRDQFSFELRHERATDRSNDVKEADALKRWLDWLMPYARARLRRALGLAVGADDLFRILCEQPARILASATRLDVFFSLARLPVEIRLSGIDRDPGWVPAAGRFIAFHYE